MIDDSLLLLLLLLLLLPGSLVPHGGHVSYGELLMLGYG